MRTFRSRFGRAIFRFSISRFWERQKRSSSAEDSVTERDAIDRLVTDGKIDGAARALGDLWRREPHLRTASFVVSRYERLRSKLSLLCYRVAIARSFTVEPVILPLRAE